MSWKSIEHQWFLIALALVVLLGTLGSRPLAFLAELAHLRSSIVFIVMGLMALPLPLAWVRKSLLQPWPAILASLVNMGIFPIVTLAFSLLLGTFLGGGLIVAATVPCTLASAAVWTRRAGGDDTVAVLVTLITNLVCVIVTPLWLVLLLGKAVQLNLVDLVSSLLLIVLLPMVLAQLARRNRVVAAWASSNTKVIATSCQIGILCMVFLGSVQMGQRMADVQTQSSISFLQMATVIVLACALHLLVLAIGWWLAARTKIARPQRIAVAIAGSQKTLMVGLKLAIDCGVSILPMVVYHISQLVLDTILADRWRRYDEANAEELGKQ